MQLDVYYKKGKEKSYLYDDAGDGYDYKKDGFSLRTFGFVGKEKEVIIQQHKSGKYITTYNDFKIKLHGLPFEISKIELDNEEMEFETVKVNGDNTLVIDKNFTELHIIG